MKTITLTLLLIFVFSISVVFSQVNEKNQYNCFSILVGKDATTDGAVLFAHNEDDYGRQLVNMFKVPHRTHKEGESITFKKGATISQIKETNSYIWAQMVNQNFADAYMNEWGVTIGTNQCRSKEDNGELKDGGISFWLRRLMAERAKTAREAVKIAGKIVEEYGYASSGRSYCIADPNEAWILALVHGNQWIAQKVPDNEIVIIPNYYTIEKINLSDTINFLGNKNIINYAIKKGWYNPETDGEFNFRTAYSAKNSIESMSNIARKWVALNIISEKQYSIDDNFPFSIKPKQKISVPLLIEILRKHYEGTPYDSKEGHPHKNELHTICANTTQFSFVAQLRNKMPTEIGSILWFSPRRSCVQPFIPIYLGIEKFPDPFTYTDDQTSIKNHFTTLPENIMENTELAFPLFRDNTEKIDENYYKIINQRQLKIKEIEKKLFKNQLDFETGVLEIFNKSPIEAQEHITEYVLKNINILRDFNK